MRPPIKILHRRSGAAIGHVGDVDADHVVQQHAAEMGGGARAGRAELHLALVRLGVGDELLEVLHRQVLARDQHDRHLRDQADRGEIGLRVVERPLVEGLGLGVGADGADDEVVAVGGAVGDALASRSGRRRR